MKVDLDPAQIRSRIELWREVVDLKIPMSSANRSQLMMHRAKILGSLVTSAQSWTIMLDACQAELDAAVEMEKLKEEILDFKAWAEEGLRSLLDLAKEDR